MEFATNSEADASEIHEYMFLKYDTHNDIRIKSATTTISKRSEVAHSVVKFR